jgi:fumagillin biosynthesis dioxygenase
VNTDSALNHRPPQVRDALEDAILDADTDGVGIWGEALDDTQVTLVREKVMAAAGSEGHAMYGVPGYDFDGLNIRVNDLFAFDEVFQGLAFHPAALRVISRFLGPRALLSNFNGNITRPGSGGENGYGGMHVHADQGFVIPPWPDVPLAFNCIWVIDDFTEETGATRYLPESHRSRGRPQSTDPAHHDLVSMEASAGSLILMDGRVWHTTGVNRSERSERIGLFGYYVRSWLRPQMNWSVALAADLQARLSDEQREMLGLNLMANTENLMGFRNEQALEGAERDK